jgi:hypothetical protein
MKWDEYEQVTGDLAKAVFAHAEGNAHLKITTGSMSKQEGISGFPHQIDVVIQGKNDLIMVECKSWKDKVKAEHLLTFIARILDIKARQKDYTIHPVMVTSSEFQSGCHVLADYYGVDLETISSPEEFAFKYKGLRFVGIKPTASVVTLETGVSEVKGE